MNVPISTIPARPRVRRKRKTVEVVTQAAGPVLIAAAYDAETPSLTLTFDRAVNLAGEGEALNPETITVLDGVNGIEQFNTPSSDGSGTATLVVMLFSNGPWVGSGVAMTCGAGTGIVDDDDQPWAGVAGLSLPFP